MSQRDRVKAQRAYDALTGGFLRPLLTGKAEVALGRALPPAYLDHFAWARPSDAEVEHDLLDALDADASVLAPSHRVPLPDRGVAAVAMAAHDLLLVTDPALDRAFARGARTKILGFVDRLLHEAGPPLTRGAALARHAIVRRAIELERKDVTVRNWAYTYRYFGRPVPPRVVAMPRVRMVRSESVRVPAWTAWQALDPALATMLRVRALIERSPVTALLLPHPDVPLVLDAAVFAVLSDDILRNGIAHHLVAGGRSTMKRFGAVLATLEATGGQPRLLYWVLALVYEALVISVLDARGTAEPQLGRPADADAALFCAVLPAMVGAPSALEPLLDLAPDDLARVRSRAVALDREVGPEATARAVALLARAGLPPLDHERDVRGEMSP